MFCCRDVAGTGYAGHDAGSEQRREVFRGAKRNYEIGNFFDRHEDWHGNWDSCA